MNLVLRNSPFAMFDEDFFGLKSLVNNSVNADIREDEGQYVVQLNLPGIAKEDVKIEYLDNILTISGEKKDEVQESGKYFYRERTFGKFARSFKIEDVDEQKLNASLKDGVLEITLPKSEKKCPKLITIN
ncbi:MAG: Hsp20/alpha crystallin family protein [Bacteriovoracaceae bacterium]|nr:Hsp20/alpha crystallin family protein [Bacteriovoracaceae bacterium]